MSGNTPQRPGRPISAGRPVQPREPARSDAVQELERLCTVLRTTVNERIASSPKHADWIGDQSKDD